MMLIPPFFKNKTPLFHMLSSSRKSKDLAPSLPFVPSSDASVEYGGALLLYSQLKRIKTKIWELVSELLLGQKPKSIDANLDPASVLSQILPSSCSPVHLSLNLHSFIRDEENRDQGG